MNLTWPADGPISQRFGANPEFYAPYGLDGHEGIDVALPVGTPLVAPHDGVATPAYSASYGLYVIIRWLRWELWVGHMSQIDIETDTYVEAGQRIGLSGNTGRSTGPHYHLSLRPRPPNWHNGYRGCVDPLPYLKEEIMSKLGVHFQGQPELGTPLTESIRESDIKWIKGINPEDWHAPASEMFPDQQVLAREWIGGDDRERAFMMRGVAGALEYFNELRPRYEKLMERGIYHVAAANEPHPGSIEEMGLFESFMRRWAQLVAELGMRPWVWSWGVGWPPLEFVPAMAQSVQMAVDAGGGLEVHEYGAPSVLSGDGWWTLRIKRTLAALDTVGVSGVPVFIGECGIDGGVIPHPTRRGWREWSGWGYPAEYGLDVGTMTEERYWRQMSAYDDALCEIPEVVAATPFVTIPYSDWSDFDWGQGLIDRSIAKHAQSAEEESEWLLPSAETATDLAILQQKCRWWLEEYTRALEAGHSEYAEAILYDLIDRENGLMYRAEEAAQP